MKTILTLVLLLTVSVTFAQMRFPIPVQELDSIAAMDSSAFRMHPVQLDVEVNEISFDIYRINAVTTFYENIKNNPYYKAKNTQTISMLELPKAAFDLSGTLNADKSYNIPKLNQILAMFGMKYRVPNQ